jgi:hypothetical protein
MPFQSYSDLQASVARWLKRNNLSDAAPDFIALAEARLNRKIRVRQMRTWYTVTPTQQFITLPGDYNEAIRLTYGDQKLDFRSEDSAEQWMEERGFGNEYTIAGNRIWLLTAVDGTTKFTLHYYQQIEALSTSNTSNWLLEDAPDIYLYASLLEAEPYIKNDERIAVWTAALTTALQDLEDNDQSGQYSGSALTMKNS